MVERFFNIWYLMRHGSRRLKQRVRWLTCFLRGFYTPGDREGLARDFLSSGNHRGRADLMAALSESMDDPVYRKALSHAAGRDLVLQSDTRERIGHLVDLRDIDPEQADMVELRRRVLAMQREWPNGMDARGFWDLLGGSLEIGGAEKRRIIEQLPTMEIDRLIALTETLRNELAELCAAVSLSENELGPYRAAVRDGSIRHRYDLAGASAAALHENTPSIAAVGCLAALNTVNSDPDQVRATRKRFAGDGDRLWARVDGHSDIRQSDTPLKAYHRGCRLEELGFPADAESSLRKGGGMEFDRKHCSWAWCQLGYYLAEKWGRYEEADAAYRQAIALDPKLALPWNGLGMLLQDPLGRYAEAEAAYRQAMTLDPKYAWPWNNLATLLQDELGRYEEAEQAYLRSLELWEPKEQGYPHGHLAYLYWFHLNRPEDARQHAELGRQVPECYIGRLLDAAQHLAEDSPGPAFTAFDAALAKEDAKLWSNFLVRVQRTLRYAHAKGYGPQFREWMEAADYPARYAPLYWAFLALLEGEDILRNVNPEVRRTAERIYRGLAGGAQPPTPVKKARRRRPPN